jgi:hypothetical protein
MTEPWKSEKVWLSLIACGMLVGLSYLGRIDLEAWHVVIIFGSLIGGRALENLAAIRSEK